MVLYTFVSNLNSKMLSGKYFEISTQKKMIMETIENCWRMKWNEYKITLITNMQFYTFRRKLQHSFIYFSFSRSWLLEMSFLNIPTSLDWPCMINASSSIENIDDDNSIKKSWIKYFSPLDSSMILKWFFNLIFYKWSLMITRNSLFNSTDAEK